ncbi:hypothetical protein [Halococcus sp. AFM35]|uniref:hypothetical protein n=1 Tax=Halococcus sp. AFM35 TaxID=3421653 RepID=UPI003EC155B6
MFTDEQAAREFAFDVADALADDLDRYLVRPSFDGANLYFDSDEARARGALDGRGYRVREGTIDEDEAVGDFEQKLVVLQG